MNILLINHYAGSPVLGMEFRPFYLAHAWHRLGHKVTIVAASHSHLRAKQPSPITGPITCATEEEIDYLWLRTPPYKRSGSARVINIAAFVFSLWRQASKVGQHVQPEVVIASSTYPLDIFPAWKMARYFDARLVYEVHDLWPLSPKELGGYSRWHPFIAAMQVAENFAYRKADVVVSMLPNAEDHMRQHGLAPGKFVHVPNGVNLEEWRIGKLPLPDALRRDLAKIKMQGRLAIIYAGGHGVSNALDPILDAAMLTRHEPFDFVFVGQGAEKERLIALAKRRALSNVYFHDSVPKRTVPSLLAEADILVLSWQHRPLYRFGISPNKLMDYMMAAKPVIIAVEAGNDIVGDAACGITVPPENPAAMANAIRSISNMSTEERKRMGERGRAYVTSNHDYQLLAVRFLDALKCAT